jgi:PAS domain S-box-containing protein
MGTHSSSDLESSNDPVVLRTRIAALEQALAAERAQSENYKHLLASVNDAIILLDNTFRIQKWNPAAERIYGWTAEEAIGNRLSELLPTRYLNNSTTEDAFTAITKHGVWTGLVAQQHRDGHEIIIDSAVRPLYNAAGELSGLVGINRDVTARYVAEQALLASEERFRLAIDHFPYVFVIYDSERRLQFVNTVGIEMSGITEDELLGKRDEDVFDAEATREYLPLLAQAVETRQTQHGQCTVVLNGTSHWIEVTYVPILDADGALQRILGITHNITARAQAELALKHSEANLRAFFESASPAHYLLDTNYTIIAFNRVTAQEVRRIWHKDIRVGDNVLDYVNPSNRDTFITHYQRCLAGEPSQYERRVAYPNGITNWYELRYMPVINDGGKIIGVAFSGDDITARKVAEATLAHREAQLTGIIDSAMDAIITVDTQQRIVLFNRAAEQAFGCRATDVLGQSLDQFIPVDVQNSHRNHISKFGTAGITRRSMSRPGLLEAVRANGTRFPIEATISQIVVNDEMFYTVILRDISERLQLQAQLIQAQKLESVGQLAGGIAHDFNNLLTVIGGASEMARETLPSDHPAQADLEDVIGATERAAALTRQLLAFARRQVLAPRVLDLNALLRETEQLLRRLIGADIQLITQPAPNLPAIKADPNQIQQVLINLAVNARDAMPNGGTLVISTTLVAPDVVPGPYQGVFKWPQARIIVQDTGIGIDSEVLPRIFEPFFTTKEPGKGTGLGLSTSYGIVKQHGGSIWVESTVGKGTTITVDLPVVESSPELVPESGSLAELPRGTETVLLVEDEDSVRAHTTRILHELGYTVLEAANSAEAHALSTATSHIDLLLTDLVMPGENGIILATQLLKARPNLAVLYMSGYAEHTRLESLWSIFDGVILQKPFWRSELARAVRKVLDARLTTDPP